MPKVVEAKGIPFTVNGTRHTSLVDEITADHAVQLAFPGADDPKTYVVSYTNGGGNRPSAEGISGNTPIKLREDGKTAIRVTSTGNA